MGDFAHGAVTRRPPIPLYTPGTGGYAVDVGVWDLSVVQGAIFCRAGGQIQSRFATFPSLSPTPTQQPPTPSLGGPLVHSSPWSAPSMRTQTRPTRDPPDARPRRSTQPLEWRDSGETVCLCHACSYHPHGVKSDWRKLCAYLPAPIALHAHVQHDHVLHAHERWRFGSWCTLCPHPPRRRRRRVSELVASPSELCDRSRAMMRVGGTLTTSYVAPM